MCRPSLCYWHYCCNAVGNFLDTQIFLPYQIIIRMFPIKPFWQVLSNWQKSKTLYVLNVPRRQNDSSPWWKILCCLFSLFHLCKMSLFTLKKEVLKLSFFLPPIHMRALALAHGMYTIRSKFSKRSTESKLNRHCQLLKTFWQSPNLMWGFRGRLESKIKWKIYARKTVLK